MASSFYTCYLQLSEPVSSPKLFIHTEALAVPGRKVEVRAEDGLGLDWPLTGRISFIPYTMLTTVPLSIGLIITLCISEEGLADALNFREPSDCSVCGLFVFVKVLMERLVSATLMCPAELQSQGSDGGGGWSGEC